MSGFDAADPWYVPAPLHGPPAPRRIAVVADPTGGGIHPEVTAGIYLAADALTSARYEVQALDPPAVAEIASLWAAVIWTDVRHLWPRLIDYVGADAATFLERGLDRMPPLDQAGYAEAWSTRTALARAWQQFMQEHPLVLGPISTQPAFPIGTDLLDPLGLIATLQLVVCANFLCLPAAAVPVGLADGLPQAVQIIGPRFREDLILDAAQAIEDHLGVLTPIEPRRA
jgi:amidase